MKKWILSVLILVTVFSLIAAQTEEPQPEMHPLLQLLALVPDIPAVTGDYFGYSDFRAQEAARPAAGRYEAWVEYETAQEGTEEEQMEASLWLNTVMPLGAQKLSSYLLQGGPRFPEIMGFDFFDIDRALSFGQPPADAQIFMGEFDADAITAAREARDFVQTEIGGLSAWCSNQGCDQGFKVDLKNTETADVFGGDFGRKQPSVLVGSFLFNSGDLATVETIAATYNGEQSSLAENPTYIAAVEAITQEGWLRQAMFVSPLLMTVNMEEMQTFEEFGALPVYELLVLADTATETDQQVIIALVYDNEADAEIAAEVIPARLTVAESVRMRRTFDILLKEREAVLQEPVIYTSDNGKTVITFTVTYPHAPDTRNDVGFLTQSGITYTLFYAAFAARDLAWLVPQP